MKNFDTNEMLVA